MRETRNLLNLHWFFCLRISAKSWTAFCRDRIAPNCTIRHPVPSIYSSASRRVQKYKRTLRPARRAVVEFIYHHDGERHHRGLGNAFVFLVTTGSFAYGVKESVSVATYSPSWACAFYLFIRASRT